MSTGEARRFETPTLSFDEFWTWLILHPNCILRGGTPDVVVYDDHDLHWHFTAEGAEMLLVQVLRGKRLMGEILVQPEKIAYVQGYEGDGEGEHVFELFTENEKQREAAYFFVLCHGFDDESMEPTGRAVH